MSGIIGAIGAGSKSGVIGDLTVSDDLTVSTGNLVIGTAGKGIDFGITSVHGTSNTAEILNDYEEGYWTPTGMGSGGAIDQSTDVQYVKIGSWVWVCFDINFGSGAGTNIEGLPFTAAIGDVSGGSIGYGTNNIGLVSSNNGSHINFYNGTSLFDVSSTRQIGFFTYRTAQN